MRKNVVMCDRCGADKHSQYAQLRIYLEPSPIFTSLPPLDLVVPFISMDLCGKCLGDFHDFMGEAFKEKYP